MRKYIKRIYQNKDEWWLAIWICGMLSIWIWDVFFLNKPARLRLQSGLLNTFSIALIVSIFSFVIGWLFAWTLTITDTARFKYVHLSLTFILNLVRSIPQIIGVLALYYLIVTTRDISTTRVILLMGLGMTIFIFVELVDLMRERISYFKKTDFYVAMLVNGISEHRIINFDILWKNSLVHIINKLVFIFGMTIFLQCSVDFILSVGLSTEISSINLPSTLGSLLAKTDSKQDILAIGYALTHLSYLPKLFFEHLQGISTAFYIVFSLFSIYKIANGFAERRQL